MLGFTGNTEKVTVNVPEGDIQPWDAETKHTAVGTDADRVDGPAKASGRARYASDQNFEGLLQGKILRSEHAKAKVLSVDFTEAEKMPGVKAVVLARPDVFPFQARWIGDEIAAVAAETIDQAQDAIEKIVVEYEEEFHNTDIMFAEGAPTLNEAGEVTDPWQESRSGGRGRGRRGGGGGAPTKERIDNALAGSAVTHTATYQTQVQMHCSHEPHGLTAKWEGNDLEVWASVQSNMAVPNFLTRTLASNWGIQANNVISHAEFVGGGFGSKFSSGVEGATASALAFKAKAPVRLMLDRYEEQTCTGNRPSALMQIRAGADAGGKITAFDFRNWGGPGYSGRGGRATAPTHYSPQETTRAANIGDLATDTDAARSMRAPGYPQGYFGAEMMIDELAVALDMDPLEFRLKNDSHRIRQAEWRMAAERFGWAERRQTGERDYSSRKLTGAGMGSAMWGSAGRGGNSVTCRILTDGTVQVRNGAQDIGTGMKTVMAILAAEELGLQPGQITAVMGDSRDPNGPGSGGSTTTPSLSPTVRHAAASAKNELAALVAKHLEVDAEEIVFSRGTVGTENGTKIPFREACKLINGMIETNSDRFNNYEGYERFVCGCQFAEVEVDTQTGNVKVLKLSAVQDAGLIIAKKLAESQVIGAMIEGISYALHEERHVDHGQGRVVNGDMLFYKIATAGDIPPLEAHMLSVANGLNNVGAMGLGEPPSVATPAAIANAVHNAIGVPVRSLPITPDKVLAALANKK